MRMKKGFLLILILVIGLLAACQPEPAVEPPLVDDDVFPDEPIVIEEPEDPDVEPEPVEVPDPVTIEVYYPIAIDAPIADVLNEYIEGFQAEYPHITVEPVFSGGYPDVQTAIQTTIDGGGEPPALAVLLATALYDLINADYIAPLDGYIAQMEDGEAFINDFLPAYLANSFYDGQLWSIPFQRSAVVLYYNVDMFTEFGLIAPDSWETWAQAAQELTVRENGDTDWGMLFSSGWPYWLFQPLAIGAGQNIFVDDCTVAFDAPEVIDAVQFYIDLSAVYDAMPEGVQDNWASSATDFASGATAMVTHSSGSLTSILNQADFEVGVMPYPGREPGTFASVPGGGNFYILRDAPQEKQDAAWLFIEYISRPEIVADYSINTGYIAHRLSAYETDALEAYIEEVPQFLDARLALEYAGAELSIQNLGEVRTIFHDYLQRAFNLVMTAEDAMQAAQSEAEAVLVDFCP